MAKKKHRKSTKAANLQRRMVQIVNGSKDRKPGTPVFVVKKGRLIRVPSETVLEPELFGIDAELQYA